MSSERWILTGIADPAILEPIKKAIAAAGHRTTPADSLDECADLVRRRTFLCAIFDRSFFHKAIRKCPFGVPTYTVLVATSANEIPAALTLQAEGKIHDWIAAPVVKEAVQALLLRAKTFLRTTGELETIKNSHA
ncbi:MAG: hypothetical protein V1495_05590, partial [Pseudomonadota bacterium]